MRIHAIVIFLAYILCLGIDLYIFCDIRKRANQRFRLLYQGIYLLIAILCYASLTFAFNLPLRSESSSILPMMWIFYSFASIYIGKVIYMLSSLIGRIFSKKGGKNHGIPIGAFLGCAVFAFIWYGALVTRYQIVVNNVEIASKRVPKEFDGFKILQFSDTHVGTWGNDTTFISSLVDSINAQKPDLILFTGDVVNRQTSELAPFMKIFCRLSAPHGIYAVHGNHDYGGYVDWSTEGEYYANLALLANWTKQMGWTMLNNDYRYIHLNNDSIAVIGVENWGEPPFNQLGNLSAAYPNSGPDNNLNDSTFKVLMTHNPVYWDESVTKLSNVDLSLAGHTHAMQMMLKFGDWKWSPSVFKYKKWGGLYKADNGKPMYLYVNIGVGEIGFPARIGAAYPEISTFTLKHSDNE